MINFVPFAVALSIAATIETPETPPGKVCPAVEGPSPKTEKDVKTQPYCEPQPTPSPEPTKPGKKVQP
jgi:hypothetical protein